MLKENPMNMFCFSENNLLAMERIKLNPTKEFEQLSKNNT